MSHFRKLTVNDTEYEYNIGKKFVSIRSKVLGSRVDVEKSVIGFFDGRDNIVTPKMVSNYILGKARLKPEDCFPTCKCEGVEKTLTVKPFDNEIYDKKILVFWCKDCVAANAEEI